MTNEEAIKVLNTFKDLNDQMQPPIVFDAIDTAVSALKSHMWISVDDMLPERDSKVLVFIKEMNGSDSNIQISRGWAMKYVTHWMPLPQPPEPPAPFAKGAVVEDDKSETILTEVKALIDSFEEELLSRACQYGDEIEDIESAEELDAVPVVRCKDCIHFREDGYCNVLMGYCGNEDWFCASGRRNERR